MSSERTWDWVDWIAAQLIRFAARRAPDSLSDRLEEEWLADSAAWRGAIPRVRFALGCCWAVVVIATVVVARERKEPATGRGQFISFPRGDFPFFTGSTTAFVLVVSLQVAALCGLAVGLGVALWH